MKRKIFIDWLMHMIGYTFVLITMAVLFKNNIYIDNTYYGLWAFITIIIIYILNKTIKPLLFIISLPITAMTLGLFYPIINIIILKIADIIMQRHFKISGLFMMFIISIVLSILNIIIDKIIKNMLKEKNI